MFAQQIEVIDTQQFGSPRTGAAYLIRGSSPVLIESGTAASAETICDVFSELAEFAESGEVSLPSTSS